MLSLALIWYACFLLSLTCHEAAHALVAKWGGDDTAYEAGQVTLDPLPHIRREPLGMVLLPLLTFFTNGWMLGWASAPFDPAWQQRYPRRAALMALAGPVANFILAGLALLGMKLGIMAGVLELSFPFGVESIVVSATTQSASGLSLCLSIVFFLNLLLGIFNLIPLPPLDGASVLALFLPEETAQNLFLLIRNPSFQFIGMIVAWQMGGKLVFPVFSFILRYLPLWLT